MSTYKSVEVWMEDSEYRKVNLQEVSIDLVDDRTINAKTEMLRDELYTVHCRSPISVFCEVFVITASRVRKRAARFHLDKSLAISKDASGSSVDHTEGLYNHHGLRTPKKQFRQGKLGSVEVEIRRIGDIVKGEPRGEHEVDESEGGATEFCMIDDFSQPAWMIFHFDIGVKESLAAPAWAAKPTRKRASQMMLRNRSHGARGSQSRNSNTEGSSNEPPHESYRYLDQCKKYSRHDGSACVDEVSSDRLRKEYQKEEAEERRLLQKLQERLETKRTRNLELRRLLGEGS